MKRLPGNSQAPGFRSRWSLQPRPPLSSRRGSATLPAPATRRQSVSDPISLEVP